MNDENQTPLSTTIAILAGGKSSRMGTDKSFVVLQDKPLIQHVIDRVGVLGWPMILIANDAERYHGFGLPVFADVVPNKGSLGGIYTAISTSNTDYTLCVACDMPFLNVDLLRYLASLRQSAEVVMPRLNDHPEPLHAVYHRRCLPVMRTAIDRDQLKIGQVIAGVTVRYVEHDELARYDADLRSFANLNTPDDVQAAQTESP